MIENPETWGYWMTGLGLLAVVAIFGSAWYWVSSIRKGNQRFRFRQRRREDEEPATNAEKSYPGSREDLK